jgi:hypothetical protein
MFLLPFVLLACTVYFCLSWHAVTDCTCYVSSSMLLYVSHHNFVCLIAESLYKNMVCFIFCFDTSSLLWCYVDSFSLSDCYLSSVPSAWLCLTYGLHCLTNVAVVCRDSEHALLMPRETLLLHSFYFWFLSFLHSVFLPVLFFLELQRKVS